MATTNRNTRRSKGNDIRKSVDGGGSKTFVVAVYRGLCLAIDFYRLVMTMITSTSLRQPELQIVYSNMQNGMF